MLFGGARWRFVANWAVVSILLAFCVLYALGRVIQAVGPIVKESFKSATMPFIVTWKVLEAGWKGGKWVRKRIKAMRRKPAYGVATWATDKALKKAGHFKSDGFPVVKRNGRMIFTDAESCALMIGQRGAGKSQTMGCQLHLARRETFITYDPPGELLNTFRAPLEAKGYKVLVVDISEPSRGLHYDPVAYLENSRRYEWHPDLQSVAQLITADISAGSENKHFSEFGMRMVAGILGYMVRYDRRNASLYSVAKLLTVVDEKYRNTVFDRIVALADDATVSAINAFRSAGPNEQGSFRTSLTNALEVWTWDVYRDLCAFDGDCESRLDWDDIWLSPQPVAVFIVGGMVKTEVFRPILRVMFGQAALSAARQYDRTREAFPRKVKLMIDEMPTLGKCLPLLKVVTEMRKVNVNLFGSLQSMSQLDECYGPKGAGIFRDNCDLLISGSGKQVTDYEQISQLLGDTTVTTLSIGRGGESENENKKRMVTVSDQFRLEPHQQICLMRNLAVLGDKPFKVVEDKLGRRVVFG